MIQKTWLVLVVITIFGTFVSATQGQSINEEIKITANDGLPGDHFGYAVAIDQGVIVVGAPQDDDNGIDAGSAYLFETSTGSQITKLLPNDGSTGDEFGFSIAVGGNIIAVGAPLDEHNGVASGSVYLFDASTGVQLDKLTPIDGESGDEFGYSVAVDAGVVAVGALRNDDLGDSSGSAYLFDVATGAELEKLLPDEGAPNQSFGVSIAIENGIVAVGSRTYFELGEGFTFASAYLFDASNGNQLDRFISQNINGDTGGFFSDTIDIDNGLVAIGAWARSIFFDHSGAAYVYDTDTGSQLQYIFPMDGHDRDNFGISISISNGVVAIGAHQDDDNGFNSGSAYLYDATTGTQIDKLLASDGEMFDRFGSSIANDDNIVVVGAIGDDNDTGAIYLFGEPVVLLGDVNLDGAVNLLDVAPFVELLSNGEFQAEADVNGDGTVNLLDVAPFVQLLSGG